MKVGDLVVVDKGFAHKHGSGIVIATRTRYPHDPWDEELIATVVHTKTKALKEWSSHYLEVVSAGR